MRKYFKYFLYLYVFIGYSLSNAGSYDDFIAAVTFDQPATIEKLLVRGFDPNTPNDKGVAGILVALQSEAPKSAMLLAQSPQTNVNVQNQLGETPLMLAAINNQLDLAKILIARGADVNREGWTPLHYAAAKGHREMMRLLLENDAYLDSESANGTTPLMMAAFSNSPLAVKLLLEEGADPTLVNHANASALDIALSKENQQSAFYIRAFIESWFIQNPTTEDSKEK
jgi:ankyrin repeat protein